MIGPDLVAIINILVVVVVSIANMLTYKTWKAVKPARLPKVDESEEERKVKTLLPSPSPQIDVKQGIAGLSNLFLLFWIAIIFYYANNPIMYYESINIRNALHLFGLPAALLGSMLYTWAKISPADPAMSIITPRLRMKIIIKTVGPYRYLRYPNLLGLLLAAVGTMFLIANPLYLLLIIPGMVITFVSQIEITEKAVTGLFPEDYGEYRTRTPWKLIPHII